MAQEDCYHTWKVTDALDQNCIRDSFNSFRVDKVPEPKSFSYHYFTHIYKGQPSSTKQHEQKGNGELRSQKAHLRNHCKY